MSEAVYRMRLSFEGQRFALTDLSQADLNEAEAADAYACLSLEG